MRRTEWTRRRHPITARSMMTRLMAVAIWAVAGIVPAAAQDRAEIKTPGKAPRTDIPAALVERMDKESSQRMACKKAICESIRAKKAEGAPLTCKVVKTWAAPDLKNKILKGKMEWKWGHAQCEAEVKLDRALVARIAAEPKLVVKVGKHTVACNLEHEDGKETHRMSFAIDPTVTFENGKATNATLGWSQVDGSTVAKTALWSATAVDNTFNVLQGAVVEQINEFLGPSCDEVAK